MVTLASALPRTGPVASTLMRGSSGAASVTFTPCSFLSASIFSAIFFWPPWRFTNSASRGLISSNGWGGIWSLCSS